VRTTEKTTPEFLTREKCSLLNCVVEHCSCIKREKKDRRRSACSPLFCYWELVFSVLSVNLSKGKKEKKRQLSTQCSHLLCLS
jgi:hypothetical protein